MIPKVFQKKIRTPFTKNFRILVDFYLVCLALVKLPWRGAIDYIGIKVRGTSNSQQRLQIRLQDDIRLHLRPNFTDIKIFEQIFLAEDCKVPIKSFQPKWIIDGGAHIGCASMYYTSKYPQAKIISVEAEQENFQLLSENTKNLSNIHAVHAAILGKPGFASIENPQDDAWCFQVKPVAEPGISSEKCIPAVTIANLVERSDSGKIDLLKLDIEGAELEVFSNFAEHWLATVKVIVIELHDRLKPGCSASFESAVSGYSAQKFETLQNVVWINLQA